MKWPTVVGDSAMPLEIGHESMTAPFSFMYSVCSERFTSTMRAEVVIVAGVTCTGSW